jgi:hypothetical protein
MITLRGDLSSQEVKAAVLWMSPDELLLICA